jgi:hypothetical protein
MHKRQLQCLRDRVVLERRLLRTSLKGDVLLFARDLHNVIRIDIDDAVLSSRLGQPP